MRFLPAIAVALAVSSGAFAKDKTDRPPPPTKAQDACATAAFMKYNEATLAAFQSQGLTPTVENVLAKRRLMEAYCAQFVGCMSTPPVLLGIEFSHCLDETDADRLRNAK